jgi:hypothetical protein
MAIKDSGKKLTYRLTNEFRLEDMFAALNSFRPLDKNTIDKWRADEEERQSASIGGKVAHWRSRFGKSRAA